jgi:chromosome segregation ATPase
MSLEDIVHRLEQGVVDLGKRFVPGASESTWREEADRLAAAKAEHDAHAQHFRDAARQVRTRIAENEVRVAILASKVETYIHTKEQAKAYPLALELDELRRQLAEDRARLPCDEKAYRMHRARIAELDRRLTEVDRKLQRWASV